MTLMNEGEGLLQQNGVQAKQIPDRNGNFAANSASSRPTCNSGDEASASHEEEDDTWGARTWRRLKTNLKDSSVAGGQQHPPPRLRRGPSIREGRGFQYYLRKEVDELSELIGKLETAVMNAHSFREKASSLVEEAHRAMGRLELAIQAQQHQELIVVASEMKACVRRGLTLVHVYGEFSMTWKVVTQLFRSAAYEKFDKAIADLQSLLPPAKPIKMAPTPSGGTSTLEPSDSTNAQPRTPPHSGSLPPALNPALAHATTAPSPAPGPTPTSAATNSQARGLGRLSNSLSTTRSAAPSQAAPTNSLSTTRNAAPSQAAPNNTTRATVAKATPPPQGKILKEGKHDRVLSAAFVPPQASSNCTCLWWSTSCMLEFWTEAGGSTTGFRIGKDSQVVTAIGIDSSGNVWTGHQKGLVRVRQKMQWDLVLSDKAFNLAIKCIAFDERQGTTWVGDEGGHVKVMRCSYHDPDAASEDEERSKTRRSGPSLKAGSLRRGQEAAGDADGEEVAHTQLDVIATLQPTLLDKITVGFLNQCFGCGKIQAAKQAVCDKPPDRPTEGPIRCIHLQDDKAWISGGISNSQPWLSVFDSTTFQHIDTWECGVFGTATAMEAMTWQLPFPTPRAATDPQSPRHSQAGATAPAGSHWRLLTGHENGQLLLWNPNAKRLSPLIMIGPPGSPIRGVKYMEEEQLVVTAHYSGDMHMFAVPPLDVIVPPIAQASKGSDSFGVFKPKTAVLKLHKSAVVGMVSTGAACATWSVQGSIRLWTAHDFVDTMGRQGLIRSLSHQTSSGSDRIHSQGTSGSALERACNGATADMRNCRQLQHSQSAIEAQPSSRERSLQTQYSNLSQAASQEAVSGAGPSATQTGLKPDGSDTSGMLSNTSKVPDFGGAVQLIDSCEITLQRQIGSGAYGKVYLAEWLGCQVAVKELTGLAGDFRDTKAWQDMQHEVHMLGTYNHPNIMRFMAVCLNPPMIVMQYYSHGSLFDLLTKAQRQNVRAMRELAWQKRLGMLKDVAAGMHYLHTRRPPVVHGDLRSPNLLLDLTIDSERPRFHVKIADFGLARMLGQSQSIAISKTTNPRWTAPEVIRDFVLGPAGDVYSFAIIMWEMLTWKQPYEDMMSAQVIFSTVTTDFRPSVEEGDVAGNPGVTLPQFKELMEQCWSPDANKRPTFKRVVEVLQGMLEIESQAAKDAAATQKGSQKGGKEQGGDGGNAPKSGGMRRPPGSKSPSNSKGVATKPDGQQRPFQDSASSTPPSEVAILLSGNTQAGAEGHTPPPLSSPEHNDQQEQPSHVPPPHPPHHKPSHSRSRSHQNLPIQHQHSHQNLPIQHQHSHQNLPYQHQHSGPQPPYFHAPPQGPHSHPHHPNQHHPPPHSHNCHRNSTDEQQPHSDPIPPPHHPPAHGRKGRGRGHSNEGSRGGHSHEGSRGGHSHSPLALRGSSAGAGGTSGGGKQGAPNRSWSGGRSDSGGGGVNHPAFVPHATATQRQAFNPSRLARAGSAADDLPPHPQGHPSGSKSDALPASGQHKPPWTGRIRYISERGWTLVDNSSEPSHSNHGAGHSSLPDQVQGQKNQQDKAPGFEHQASFSRVIANPLSEENLPLEAPTRSSSTSRLGDGARADPACMPKPRRHSLRANASGGESDLYSWHMPPSSPESSNSSRSFELPQGGRHRRNRRRKSVYKRASEHAAAGPVGSGEGSRGASHQAQQTQQQQAQQQQASKKTYRVSQHPWRGSQSRRASGEEAHRGRQGKQGGLPVGAGQANSHGASPFASSMEQQLQQPHHPSSHASPFSTPPMTPPPPPQQSEAKPYAPLASSSPFSAQPPYAPLASSSPFSAQPAATFLRSQQEKPSPTPP
uniref:Protein kinase domain-containing protein n=1 Tax=Dunaliella tertiolecta TaxID=3047 RepID=A0A7S3R324_DUNTE